MYASDRLRERRMKKAEDPANPQEPDDKKLTDRSFQLTEQELSDLSGSYQPGAEATCLVKGRIDASGKLDVNQVMPASGDQGQPDQQQPPMRMNPAIMPG